MITPEQLAGLIAVLRADTPTGPITIEVEGFRTVLAGKAAVMPAHPEPARERPALTYEQLMMAATEGIPEDSLEADGPH